MASKTEYAFKWEPISEGEKAEKLAAFKKKNSMEVEMVKSVPEGVYMPIRFPDMAEEIYNFETRPKDIWVVTYPKCGTTWTQEIVWQITRGLKPDVAKEVPLGARSPFIEFGSIFPTMASENATEEELAMLKAAPLSSSDPITHTKGLEDPRVIKSHLPVTMLNPEIFKMSKVVYVCRNPKDVCVSYFHHCSNYAYGQLEDFDKFAGFFRQGSLLFGDYWHHLKTANKLKDNPNVKIIWFEEMKKDLPKVIRDLCDFLGYELPAEKISALVDHVSIENMKQIAVDQAPPNHKEWAAKHFRKGKVGDWKNYFEGEKLEEWNKWIEESLKDTGIQMSFE